MIVGELYPDDGRIKTGPQVKEAYLPQIVRFDHPDWNLVENMMAAKKGPLGPVGPKPAGGIRLPGARTCSSRCRCSPAGSRAACGCAC